MSESHAHAAVPPGVDISVVDWHQTPTSVQPLVQSLAQRVAVLAARLQQDSRTSHRPPSTDSPYQKGRKTAEEAAPQTPTAATPARQVGGQPGQPGHRQRLLPPTDLHMIMPPACSCGHPQWTDTPPYSTHQVIERPAIQMDVTHLVWQQARCPHCQQWSTAPLPPEHVAGYGPRLTALVGESAGTHGTSRRTIQTFCASVLQRPLSLGAMQQMSDRVTQALAPH